MVYPRDLAGNAEQEEEREDENKEEKEEDRRWKHGWTNRSTRKEITGDTRTEEMNITREQVDNGLS